MFDDFVTDELAVTGRSLLQPQDGLADGAILEPAQLTRRAPELAEHQRLGK